MTAETASPLGEGASYRASRNLRRADLENIVLRSKWSLLLRVVDEDPVYVVGYFADVRNWTTASTLTRIAKAEILLRVKVREELSPDPGELQFGGGA